MTTLQDDDSEAWEVDCPICLDVMSPEDVHHVLQCQRHCGYNFCQVCIESFITSSKDDYMEASDGNRHVKVFLHCPMCRSDLSATIRDTLLLRKADAVKRLTENNMHDQLTESQERLYKVLKTKDIRHAIHKARRAEAEYMQSERDHPRVTGVSAVTLNLSISVSEETTDDTLSKSSASYEEWGVECDVDIGVHDSIRLPHQPNSDGLLGRLNALKVDPSLFAGLDFGLTDVQREAITSLMTSGEPDCLARAALELYLVLHNVQNPNDVTNTVCVPPPLPTMPTPKTLTRMSSVYQLISESEAAHEREEKKEARRCRPSSPRYSDTGCGVFLACQQAQSAREIFVQATFLKRFPLPVRMPKTIHVNPEIITTMTFVDYTWDGTVMDAYSKINIDFFLLSSNVWQKKTLNKGVQRILDCDNFGDVQVALPGEKRILLQNVGLAGRQGAHRGDVVTHVDGVPVSKVAIDSKMIEAWLVSRTEPVTMTLNAERSVAEALKRRAIAIAEDL